MRCPVCHSSNVNQIDWLADRKHPGQYLEAGICENCGHVDSPEYFEEGFQDGNPHAARSGSTGGDLHPGRPNHA